MLPTVDHSGLPWVDFRTWKLNSFTRNHNCTDNCIICKTKRRKMRVGIEKIINTKIDIHNNTKIHVEILFWRFGCSLASKYQKSTCVVNRHTFVFLADFRWIYQLFSEVT